MPEKNRPKPVAHIYVFALTWLVFALVGVPIDVALNVFLMIAISLWASLVAFLIIRKLYKGTALSFGASDPEANAAIFEARALLKELNSVKQKIKNAVVVEKTEEIIEISKKIIKTVKKQPHMYPSAKRFLTYYLPTTTKLITNYSYIESQGIEGDNISNTMQKIESALGTLAIAYKTQLDALFSHTAIDLETDITALGTILKSEGLTDNEHF